MDREGAKQTLGEIVGILGVYDQDASQLKDLQAKLDTLPEAKEVDEYNRLVAQVRSAHGYASLMSAGQELLSYYNAHKQYFADKAQEMAQLQQALEDNQRIHTLYKQLESQLEG